MEEEILLTTAGKFKCKTSSTLQPAAIYASKVRESETVLVLVELMEGDDWDVLVGAI